VLWLYVDNIILCTADLNIKTNFVKFLNRYFEAKDLGAAQRVLGIEISRENGRMFLAQARKCMFVLFEGSYTCNPEENWQKQCDFRDEPDLCDSLVYSFNGRRISSVFCGSSCLEADFPNDEIVSKERLNKDDFLARDFCCP
jgi:hypothetical protein